MELASWRTLALVVKKADVVLEVLDAREPGWTRSRRLERMVEALGKRLVLVINKADLIPRRVAEKWKRIFENEGYPTVYMAARHHMGTRVLRRTILRLAESTPVVVAVAGYPKTGKSSIINALKGKHSASTSPVPGSPGYTRHVQLYRVDDKIYILDTPGVIPVEGGLFERVVRGRSPEEFDDPVPAAAVLIEHVLRHNPLAFLEAYGTRERDPYRILEHIAIHRGWRYKSTGEPLIEEAARTVLRDYHRAKIKYYVPPEEYLLQGRGRRLA